MKLVKIIILSVASFMVAFSTVACSADLAPTPSTDTVVVTPETDRISENKTYLAVVLDEYPELAPNSGDLLDVARQVCKTLDVGASVEEVLLASLNDYLEPETSGFIVGSAIGVFCPEYTDEMEDLVSNLT